MKLAWLTDIHLDFLEDHDLGISRLSQDFLDPMSSLSVDAFVVSGDISIGSLVESHVRAFAAAVRRPIYFVCGNHDFYFSSTKKVRQGLSSMAVPDLRYLTTSGPLSLTRSTAIVGHDGWYDGYHGDAFSTKIVMNDWLRIEDFVVDRPYASPFSIDLPAVLSVARRLSNEGAEHIERNAEIAARSHANVVIVTHVPPWPEASWHDGKPADPRSLPWYSSRLVGQAIAGVAENNPNVKFDVLCGHTHERRSVRISHNLVCHVGGSKYGSPRVTEVIGVPLFIVPRTSFGDVILTSGVRTTCD